MRAASLVAALITIVTPAGAGICEFDGSAPGTAARTVAISVGNETFYVDDRDYADVDGSQVAGGVWLYWETNGAAGLQRGGSQVVTGMVPGTVPYIPKIPLIPPNQFFPGGLVLFPAGFGGSSAADSLHMHDGCTTEPLPGTAPPPPDTIMFGHHRMALIGPG